MTDKVITIEDQDGPYQALFQKILRMVPDRDRNDKNLQRLLAFRLRIDGEAALSEYLINKIREAIIVSLEKQPRKLEPSINVLPWQVFLEVLWSGELAV